LFDAGAACTANGQCVEVCIDEVCRPVSGTGEPCDEVADCAADHECIGGACLAQNGLPCLANTSCVAVCIDGVCGPSSGLDGPCDESGDCASGLVCNENDLCKRADGGLCGGDAECATVNTACIGGSCLTDATPLAFAFGDLGCQTPGASVTSNTVTMSGFYGPLDFAVSGQGGPEVVKNGVVSGVSVSVREGDTVALRMTAPATTQGAHAASASIGQLEVPWNVRTAPNIAPGQAVKTETNVITGGTRNAAGQPFTVPETAVYAVHTYMLCRDRIHHGEYEYTWCTAYLERQNTDGSWSSVVGHSHHNGQCCTQQGYVTDRTTNTTLATGANYRFRYVAQPRTNAATTVYGSAADVKFLACE
jgi:hypothetical protein